MVETDLLIVHPEAETKIGWFNKHISDELPVNSKTQVLGSGTRQSFTRLKILIRMKGLLILPLILLLTSTGFAYSQSLQDGNDDIYYHRYKSDWI